MRSSLSTEHAREIRRVRDLLGDKSLAQILNLYMQDKYDPERFVQTAKLLRAATFMGDLFGTRANAEFLADERFMEAYDRWTSIGSWSGVDFRWRLYTAIEMAALALRRDGVFVECGVHRGSTSLSLMTFHTELGNTRQYWMFDTFEGVIAEQMTEMERDELSRYGEYYSSSVYDEVVHTFSSFPNVRIIKGVVPETLSAFDGGDVAFLHIDMNVAYPEVEALKFFWPKMAPGGVVLFDDYGFPSHEEQKRQLDALAGELDASIMLLPTGQGLLFK